MREDGPDGPAGSAEDTDPDPGSTHVAKAEGTLETRERILSAACEVIAEVGFEKIRMRMVAEHAGVSTALLHYHFENRERLFAEAMTHDETAQHLAVDLYDQLHTWIGTAIRGASSRASSPTAMWRRPAPCCSP
ncbi:TetR/AcrR family transcriptional regulator [Streptomyces glebosus]|nr:helix-turn-helix domain-containing protein [Streptomyces glebosus]